MNNIPKHWQVKRLEEVCEEIFAGREVPANSFSWIPNDDCQIPIYSNGEKNKGLYGYTNTARVNFPCVTLSARGTIGCTEVRTHPFFPIVRLMVLKPIHTLDVWYLKYAIDHCNIQYTGSSVPQLTVPTVKALTIPFPPLAEQQAIVASIEEFLSHLDNGKEQLQTALQQLKIYRQSLLKAAFEGKQTNDKAEEGKLPQGWILKKLSELGTWKGGGTPAKSNKEFWNHGNIPWVSPKDMKSAKIHETTDKITKLAVEHSPAKIIYKGSVLFVVRSGILRRTLPVAVTTSEVTINQDLQAFTPNKLLPQYVYWYAMANNEAIRKKCRKDGTTVDSIQLALLKSYPIPVCPLEEQQAIVHYLESKFTQCDQLEKTICQSLEQSVQLTQSILKKALEGKLGSFNSLPLLPGSKGHVETAETNTR